MTEYRRILLDGYPVVVERQDDELVARDGRRGGGAGGGAAAPAAGPRPRCEPTKILCVHLNYASRVAEFMTRLPPAPTYFHKPVTALNAHNADVVRPEPCRWLNYEGEIAIVIGRACRNVSPGEAGEYIAGYTVSNDYGLHDFRDTDAGSMLRGKGGDTLCPGGPGLVTGWDFRGKQIRTLVNGDVRQDGNTDEMEWDMHYLVADLARTITLAPGDLVLSGTPANSRPVVPGDVVTVGVEGRGGGWRPPRGGARGGPGAGGPGGAGAPATTSQRWTMTTSDGLAASHRRPNQSRNPSYRSNIRADSERCACMRWLPAQPGRPA